MRVQFAAAFFGLGMWFAVRPPARLAAPEDLGRLGRVGVTGAVAGFAVLLMALDVAPALFGIAGAALIAVGRAHQQRRRRRAAERRRDQILAACEGLASDLAAGQPPNRALRSMAQDWPELRPVADTADVGGDVPASFRELAMLPGASMLGVAAAAWAVAQGCGTGLAEVLGIATDDMRAEQATSRTVATELAAARATARLLAVLPLGVLALGSSVGGDPFTFLLETVAGQCCLASGLGLSWAGTVWMERLADQVTSA